MLWLLCAVFLSLWLVSMATSVFMGGLAHVFLIAAVAVMLIRVWSGRSTI